MNIIPPPDQRLYPFEFYSQMRRLNPVVYDERNNIWGVFRYGDVQSVLGDYTTFSSGPQRSLILSSSETNPVPFQRQSLLRSDPPYHRTLRGVVASAFTPMIIAKLEPHIENIAHEILNEVIAKGKMDLIDDLAYPLPVTIIAELLGVPIEDRNLFRGWADTIVSSRGDDMTDEHGASKNLARIINEMDSYFSGIVEERIKEPREDLITNLIKAQAEGRHLFREEILTFCTLLLLAGHVTTVNLIGNTILSLLQNQTEFRRLQDDHNLIPSTIEETLRYRSPVQAVSRILTKDTNLGGQKIQSGQMIIAWLGSANHDESVFANPERFDITRISHHAHVSFGHGIHFCLGAPLARLEGQVVLRVILQRLQDLNLDAEGSNKKIKNDNLIPLQSVFFHGVADLPLTFRPGQMKLDRS
ncbi:MAG: cytochrome P450 [Candidatus Nitrosopolaris sp.]|jgi:cytochrome P450